MTQQKSILKFSLSIYLKNLTSKLFCILLFFTFFMALGGKAGTIITQILNLIILVVLIFSNAWELGNGDGNRVEIGAMKEDVFRGFKAGFIAMIPDLIPVILLVLSAFEILPRVYISVAGILNAPFYPFYLTILPQTLTAAEQSVISYLAASLTVLIVPIVSGFGYILGYYEFSILDKIIYTNPEAKARHKQRVLNRRKKKERRFM